MGVRNVMHDHLYSIKLFFVSLFSAFSPGNKFALVAKKAESVIMNFNVVFISFSSGLIPLQKIHAKIDNIL